MRRHKALSGTEKSDNWHKNSLDNLSSRMEITEKKASKHVEQCNFIFKKELNK